MLRINNIKMPVEHDLGGLKLKVSKKLRVGAAELKNFCIAKKSIDARDKNDISYVYSVNVELKNQERFLKLKDVYVVNETPYIFKTTLKTLKHRPVVVGTGPAGLFAGLALAKAGLAPILIERGKTVDERRKDVETFFNTGRLDTSSNVQFGEGGAGTFSDGKLTTGINDGRIGLVLSEFANAGAPQEILYLSKPHIGTDVLSEVVKNLREKIKRLGGEFRFQSQMTDIIEKNGRLAAITVKNADNEFYEIKTDTLILAIGHSARDTIEMLARHGVAMEQKAFAVGLRIEHKRETIDKTQYGRFAGKLPAAEYKLAAGGAYTFCMCPGGVVVAASSEEGRLAVNGMSRYARDAENSNSAVLVPVSPRDGITFQREIESKAFIAGGRDFFAPAQLVGDFLTDRPSVSFGGVYPSYKPGVRLSDMREVLPENIVHALKLGITEMDKKLHGFAQHDAVLTAVESRSSSPVRILRDEAYNANICGIVPCGEGCGYAGGIMSAAVDGLKCAEALISN